MAYIAIVAQSQSLAWKLPYAKDVAGKKKKKRLQGPVIFHKNFRIFLAVKKSFWDCDSTCMKTMDQFGKIWYLLLCWIFQAVNVVYVSIYLGFFSIYFISIL